MLTSERRRLLLARARETSAHLDESAGRQAAAALAILHRHGLDGLRRVLGEDVRVLTGATAPHWQRFAAAARPVVGELAGQGMVEDAAFFLGWVKRLARVQPSHARRPGAPSLGRRLPSAGQLVEAELLEERTRRGGWKARHPESGLSGPVQNSGDVPSTARPGERVLLLVASVTSREMAFRYPRPEEGGGGGRPSGRRGNEGLRNRRTKGRRSN